MVLFQTIVCLLTRVNKPQLAGTFGDKSEGHLIMCAGMMIRAGRSMPPSPDASSR